MTSKPAIIAAAVVTIFLLEDIVPHYRDRTARLRHALPHVLTALLNGILTRVILAGVTLQITTWTAVHTFGMRHMLRLSPSAATVVLFILFDVWMYFWHRANHQIHFLWLFHRAHHSDIQMDTTTALRFHPGELILSTLVRLPVIAVLGVSFGQLVLFETILNLSTLFHHSNLDLPRSWDRGLSILMVTPDMHRVHHSVVREETNSNFTSLLSFWDRLFGTFRMRENTRSITLGLTEFRDDRWQRFWGFFITPAQE
jgi:sterol desaturase/sphingolipid hydroxylase (fatty acid hydroxylase superfamily)